MKQANQVEMDKQWFSYNMDTAKDKMLHRISAQDNSSCLIRNDIGEHEHDINGLNSCRHRSASLRSEASSCNSQAALMPTDHRQQKKKKRTRRLRRFLGFVCHGPCFNEKDVSININHHHQLPVKQQQKIENRHDLEESRKSIEVFGSKKGVERKLSMLTWDAIPGGGGGGDDVASDASSDLFEIETVMADRQQVAQNNVPTPTAYRDRLSI